jgi:hypothetical protein
MKKTRPMLRWAGFLLMVAVSLFALQAWAGPSPTTAPEAGKPDQITINTLAAFDKLELPPVTYFHDKHTDALVKEKKGCDTCHYVEDNKLTLTFLRRKTTKPEEIKDIYHSSCIGCHNDMAAAGKKTGPQDGFCRSCHNAEPPLSLAKLDAGMDKVLHYRHLASKDIPAAGKEKDNCSACHHVLDQTANKLVYAKGQEGSCRYCHLELPQQGVMSLQQASHQQCLECHRTLASQGVQESMPLNCRGCHGADAQAELAKKNQEVVAKLQGKEIPRLQRGQPDATLVMYDPKTAAGPTGKTVSMPPVPFNHAAHEKYSDSCRVCHHASMDACSKCHTMGGSKEGGFVTYEQAMHRPSSQQSCNGCHAAKQAAPNCSGCHTSIAQARPANTANCQQCHIPAPGTVTTSQQKYAIAESMLKNRKTSSGTFATGEIPDKVVIGELSNKYEPVEMAHLKHVTNLMNGMKDSQLANYFHSAPGTMCQGCHHNSPASKTPPNCGNCHAQMHGKTAFDAKEDNRPGLLAAHHNQCMRCHKEMAVKPVATACTECHLEKKKMALGAK